MSCGEDGDYFVLSGNRYLRWVFNDNLLTIFDMHMRRFLFLLLTCFIFGGWADTNIKLFRMYDTCPTSLFFLVINFAYLFK